MFGEDTLIKIENLEAKLELASRVLDRIRSELRQSRYREAFGVLNPDRRKAIIANGDYVQRRIQALQAELDNVFEEPKK